MRSASVPFSIGELRAGDYVSIPVNLCCVEVGTDPPVTWIVRDTRSWSDYNPLGISDLHLRFANVGSSREEMFDFSSRYGLPLEEWPNVDAKAILSPISGEPVLGTTLKNYRDAVADLKLLLQVIDSLDNENWGELARARDRIAANAGKFLALYCDDAPGFPPADADSLLDLHRRCLRDPADGARKLIMFQLNWHLLGIHYVIEIDEKGRPDVWPCTETFMEAIYSLVVIDLQKGYGFGTCPACGRLFVKRKSDKIYCSRSCGSKIRMRRLRERQGSAAVPE